MPIPAPELRAALIGKLGFESSGSGKGPHEKYVLKTGGAYLAHTMVPRGRSDLGDPLLSMIARQLGVSRRDVYLMVACTMDRETYVHRLEQSAD